MTCSSMPEQEHGRSPPETVTTASDEAQLQLPGLGDPTARRSDAATSIMVTTGGAGDDQEELVGAEGPLGDGDVVLVGTPWGLILAPTPLASMKQDDDVDGEVSAPPPCPENIVVVVVPAAVARVGEKKQCVRCGATETPQWRTQPVGRGALCNACRIRLRPAEALREPVRVPALLPPPAMATTTKEPAPAPAPEEKTQKKRKRKPWSPRKSSNLKPPEHVCKDGEVVRLRQKKHNGNEQQHQPRAGDGVEQHLPPPPALAVHAGGDELLMREPHPLDQLQLQMGDDPIPSSLDEFLFGGPAAPMLIDDDEGLVD